MPPRDPNSPPSRNRRRPEAMPGGWLWLVLLVLIVLVMVFFLNFNSGTVIDYSDVLLLAPAGDTETGNNVVKRVVFIGTDRLEGELQEEARNYLGTEKAKKKLADAKLDPKKVDAVVKRIRNNKFNCLVPEGAIKSGNAV